MAQSLGVAPQVLEYIRVEDFEGADAAALQGPDGRARCEALRLTSHMLQANRSQEGTIVTVKDLINLPRQVHMQHASARMFCASGVSYHVAAAGGSISTSRHGMVWRWSPCAWQGGSSALPPGMYLSRTVVVQPASEVEGCGIFACRAL